MGGDSAGDRTSGDEMDMSRMSLFAPAANFLATGFCEVVGGANVLAGASLTFYLLCSHRPLR